MKSVSKKKTSNIALLGSSAQEHSQFSSGPVKSKVSTSLQKQSSLRTYAEKKSSERKLAVLLSKSMEKSFLRLKNKDSRMAYVEAELTNGISHQVRVLRQQRGWTQTELAQRLKTTQANVSRLEDASYGRYSLKTLLQIGHAFDVALFVRFMPFSQFMSSTWNTSPEKFEADSYEDEVLNVNFYTNQSIGYLKKYDADRLTRKTNLLFVGGSSVENDSIGYVGRAVAPVATISQFWSASEV